MQLVLMLMTQNKTMTGKSLVGVVLVVIIEVLEVEVLVDIEQEHH